MRFARGPQDAGLETSGNLTPSTRSMHQKRISLLGFCCGPSSPPSPEWVDFQARLSSDVDSLQRPFLQRGSHSQVLEMETWGTYFQALRGTSCHSLEGQIELLLCFLIVTNPSIIWDNAGAGRHGHRSSVQSLCLKKAKQCLNRNGAWDPSPQSLQVAQGGPKRLDGPTGTRPQPAIPPLMLSLQEKIK